MVMFAKTCRPSGTWATPARTASSVEPAARRVPSTVTVPLRGRSSPEMTLSVVDLPAPLTPTTATIVAGGTEKLSPWSISSDSYPARISVSSSISGVRLRRAEVGADHRRVVLHRLGWPRGDDAPGVHHHNLVAHAHDQRHIVLYHHDGVSGVPDGPQDHSQVRGLRVVQACRGLVEQHDARPCHQCPGQLQVFLPGQWEHRGPFVGAIGQAEHREEPAGASLQLPLLPPRATQPQSLL